MIFRVLNIYEHLANGHKVWRYLVSGHNVWEYMARSGPAVSIWPDPGRTSLLMRENGYIASWLPPNNIRAGGTGRPPPVE